MNTITQNYNATKGLQNLAIAKNPISNIVFEISEDGIMEHYAGVDKDGKMFCYDKRNGTDPVYTGIHRESYNGLTEYYKSLVEDAAYKNQQLENKNFSLKNKVLFLAVGSIVIIMMLLMVVLYQNGK
jgi:hypothetical protein